MLRVPVTALGVSFDGRLALSALRAQASAAEAAGAESLWVASHLFLREPFASAALMLSATQRSRVVLMAVSPYTVHPVQIAMAAATLAEGFPDRLALCFGVGVPGDLEAAGVEPTRPVRTVREAVEVTRALLAGERVRYAGDVFSVRDRGLATGPERVPLLIAATGPQMLALAGQVADGVLISAASSVEFVRWSLEHVARSARGRALERAGLVYAAVADREQDALDRFRRTLAITLRSEHHRRNLELAGSGLDQSALARMVAAQDWPGAQDLITDDVVRRHAVGGPAGRVQARVAEYRAAGLDTVVLAGLHDPGETRRVLLAVGCGR